MKIPKISIPTIIHAEVEAMAYSNGLGMLVVGSLAELQNLIIMKLIATMAPPSPRGLHSNAGHWFEKFGRRQC